MAFQGYTLPAPVGGLNAISRVDDLPEVDALTLINVYPNGANCSIRKGFQVFATPSANNAVETLIAFPQSSGTTQVLACSNNKIYRVDSGVSDKTGATVPTSNKWQHTIFNERVFMCNGANTVQVYDGTSTINSTFTGVTLADLINVSSYKERLYFVEKNSLSFWYGNLKAIGASALTEFDMSYFFRLGGYLLYAGSYTDRIGTNTADLFFAVSSEGEILCYAGDSPSGTWGLVARYVIGKPLGYKAFIRVDNDLWINTERGIVPLSMLFSGGSSVAQNSVSAKVNPIISNYGSQISFDNRWFGAHWAAGRRVYVALPTSFTACDLLVCNIETGAWCYYQLPAGYVPNSMCVADGVVYIGTTTGNVLEFEQGYSDGTIPINFTIKLGYNFFGQRALWKKFLDCRPLMRGKADVFLQIGIDTDFRNNPTYGTIPSTTAETTPWGSPWGSPWGTPFIYYYERYGLRGQGHCGSLCVTGSSVNSPLDFNAFEIRFESGGQV